MNTCKLVWHEAVTNANSLASPSLKQPRGQRGDSKVQGVPPVFAPEGCSLQAVGQWGKEWRGFCPSGPLPAFRCFPLPPQPLPLLWNFKTFSPIQWQEQWRDKVHSVL